MDVAVKIRSVKETPCPVKWITPLGIKPKGLLLYVHGGSFTLAASPLITNMVCEIAQKSGFDVLMPEYRLAPEHPCPAAIEDVQAIYSWALEQGHDPKTIVFTGEQAGACIALASLQQCQKEGLPMPAGVVLFSPLVDLTLDNWAIVFRGMSTPAHSRELLAIAIWLYLGVHGTPMAASDPLASPLFGAMEGLPPMLIQARGDTFTLADSKRLLSAFKKAGGEATLNIWPENAHLWERYKPENYGSLVEASVEFIEELLQK